jgi:hypothetical protein
LADGQGDQAHFCVAEFDLADGLGFECFDVGRGWSVVV